MSIENVLDKKGLKYYDAKSKKYIKDEISKARKYCMVGSDNANSAGWYKVASQTMTGYNDVNITFMITSTYINYYSGVLQLHMRSENVSPIICTSLKWHSRIGFDAEDVICVVDGMTYSIYVNHKVFQYARTIFEIISESSINNGSSGIVLHNSITPESIAPTATVIATDGTTVKFANDSNVSNQVKPIALSNEDLNTLLPDNIIWYYAPGLNTIKNNPFGDGTAFGMCIYRNATGYRVQDATSLYGVKKIRYYNGSVWSDWKTFAYGEDYLSLNDGGTLKKPLNIQGDVSTNPLQVRSIVGSNGTNTVGELYLQYGANSAIKLGKEGKYTISADGSNYSGNSATATALTSSDGNATTPIYFKDGKPIACTYTLEKSVPSNAVFTDTTYTHPTTSGNKHIPSGGSEGQILSWASDGTAKWSTPVAPGVPGDYLELTGGKLTLEGLRSLTYYRSGTDVYVGHTYESDNGILGAIAMKTVDGGLIRGSSDFSTFYNILDTGNYTNYVLPKSGGTLSGNSINTFAIERTSEFLAGIKFINSNGTLGFIGMAGTPDGGLKRVSADTFSTYTILDENNMGDYVVSKSGGEFTGNIKAKNITGTLLQSTDNNASSTAATKICIQDSNGWIYTRTSAQILSDIGAFSKLGGTLEGDSLDLLKIKRTSTNSAVIGFENGNGLLGYIGMSGNPDGGLRRISSDALSNYTILDEGNYKNYTISRTGDSIEGTLKVTNLSPVAALTNNLGASTTPFNVEYIKTIALRGDITGQSYGALTVNAVGTADAEGLVKLSLGNNIASGSVNNAKGVIEIYGNNTKKTTVVPSNTTNDITVTLPNESGTLVIADDIVPIDNSIINTHYMNTTGNIVKVHITITGEFLRKNLCGYFQNFMRITSNGCGMSVDASESYRDTICKCAGSAGDSDFTNVIGKGTALSTYYCSWGTSNVTTPIISNETVIFTTYVGTYSWLSIQHANMYNVTITKVE